MKNFVYLQGAEAKHLYIVYSGEFEILRNQKKKQKRFDPVHNDRFKQAEAMEPSEIKQYLGPQRS